jgi:hypothetical protein
MTTRHTKQDSITSDSGYSLSNSASDKNKEIEDSAFSRRVIIILKHKIEKIIKMINEEGYSFKDQSENFIENDKTVSFILENDEFLESIQLIM